MDQRKQGRGWNGHFLGFWARLNCENMPVIPAWLVRSNLNDPRRIPYLLVWKDERDGEIKEAVRLARFVGTFDDHVELKRTDGSTTVLRIVWRTLPRNGGRALFLFCPYCESYSSEGGYLRPTGLGRLGQLGVMLAAYGNLLRPESWLPYVFTSPEEAAEAWRL